MNSLQRKILLINEVSRYPVLYDLTHPQFRNHEYKEELWRMIAYKVRESDGRVARAIWRKIRDDYTSLVKGRMIFNDTQDRNFTMSHKDWPLAQYLRFLDPHLEINTSSWGWLYPERGESFRTWFGERQMPANDYTYMQSVNNPQSRSEYIYKTPPSSSTYTYSQLNQHKSTNTNFAQVKIKPEPNLIPEDNNQYSKSSNLQNTTTIQEQQVTVESGNRKRPREDDDPGNRKHPREDDDNDEVLDAYDETDWNFLGYSKTVKKMSDRLQALVKYKIARIVTDAEISQLKDEHNDSSPDTNIENNNEDMPDI